MQCKTPRQSFTLLKRKENRLWEERDSNPPGPDPILTHRLAGNHRHPPHFAKEFHEASRCEMCHLWVFPYLLRSSAYSSRSSHGNLLRRSMMSTRRALPVNRSRNMIRSIFILGILDCESGGGFAAFGEIALARIEGIRPVWNHNRTTTCLRRPRCRRSNGPIAFATSSRWRGKPSRAENRRFPGFQDGGDADAGRRVLGLAIDQRRRRRLPGPQVDGDRRRRPTPQ